MILSTTTCEISNKVGDLEAIRIIKNAGFDAYDMSFTYAGWDPSHPFHSEGCVEYYEDIRKEADLFGISCNQAHAPFPSSKGNDEDEKIFSDIVRSMRCASILGAKCIIVHPKQHLSYYDHSEELKRMNIEFYKSLIPYAKVYGIRVAAENMWQIKDGRIVVSTCSTGEEFSEYIDSCDSEWITGCLDIGHVVIYGEDISHTISVMGKRIEYLHVHDNDLKGDDHMMPFERKIDFGIVMSELKKAGYEGDLTFEADGHFKKLPAPLLQDAANLLCSCGRFLIRMFEEA